MAPRELLATHTSRDLSEWEAYFHVLAVEAQGASARTAGRREERGTQEELQQVFDRAEASA